MTILWLKEPTQWNQHIDHISSATNWMLCLPWGNMYKCTWDLKKKAFKTMICPKLEYCASIWDLHRHKYTDSHDPGPGMGSSSAGWTLSTGSSTTWRSHSPTTLTLRKVYRSPETTTSVSSHTWPRLMPSSTASFHGQWSTGTGYQPRQFMQSPSRLSSWDSAPQDSSQSPTHVHSTVNSVLTSTEDSLSLMITLSSAISIWTSLRTNPDPDPDVCHNSCASLTGVEKY